ncbi:hypothetical protein [Sphingobium sp. EP60837]|uniref:hypothetical protein n=1 Tax=Sphingobium sp. EP60837 TaxID=1855519 RepID=UPI0007DD9971|nr:hypothetical protein [Sphingobium sp. EP60837]ANI79040.1 hypothetical protein EP837_02645 [Sphingobium sp. EP60837]
MTTTTKTAHTPGPWEARMSARRTHFKILHSARGKGDGYNNRVAETCQWSPAAGPQIDPTEAAANAHLMASAPDMLDALLAIRKILGGIADHKKADPDDALAALLAMKLIDVTAAKATGGAA